MPLPFNLAALNPIWLDDENDIENMANAFVEGFAALQGRANYYLDLPVFDAVRRLGKDFLPLEPDQQILILRWFDKQYTKLVKQVIETHWLKASVVPSINSRL